MRITAIWTITEIGAGTPREDMMIETTTTHPEGERTTTQEIEIIGRLEIGERIGKSMEENASVKIASGEDPGRGRRRTLIQNLTRWNLIKGRWSVSLIILAILKAKNQLKFRKRSRALNLREFYNNTMARSRMGKP